LQSASVSQDETEQWWIHHQGELPIFEYKSDKDRVEDLTGCIPLLLRPLLEWKDQDFCEIEQKFWHHKDLIVVKQNIYEFADSMKRNGAENYVSSVRSCPPRLTMLIPLPKTLYRSALRLLIRLGELDFIGMV
jgi:hypothetical protein